MAALAGSVGVAIARPSTPSGSPIVQMVGVDVGVALLLAVEIPAMKAGVGVRVDGDGTIVVDAEDNAFAFLVGV